MIPISTKTGDQGETSLANGQRVPKDSLVVSLVGTIDELSSWIGLVMVYAESDFAPQRKVLEQVQQDLYQLSAVIAKAPQIKFSKPALNRLERHSQALQTEMGCNWHTQFIHPGGTLLGAYLDLARTVARRCERLGVKYSKKEELSGAILQYLNRLSDYLYVLRCWINYRQDYLEKSFLSGK